MLKRVLIVGTSGSGKSTLAREVAKRLGLPFHASDPFYWEPDWQPAATERVDQSLDQVLQTAEWVLDGNFEHRWRELWSRADLVVWLDYSLPKVLWQVTKRNLHWLLARDTVWSGNRMTWHRLLSGIRHTWRSHPAKRVRYLQYVTQLDGVPVLRFTRQQETRDWASTLTGDYHHPDE